VEDVFAGGGAGEPGQIPVPPVSIFLNDASCVRLGNGPLQKVFDEGVQGILAFCGEQIQIFTFDNAL
jgi:hypothetical protein